MARATVPDWRYASVGEGSFGDAIHLADHHGLSYNRDITLLVGTRLLLL